MLRPISIATSTIALTFHPTAYFGEWEQKKAFISCATDNLNLCVCLSIVYNDSYEYEDCLIASRAAWS